MNYRHGITTFQKKKKTFKQLNIETYPAFVSAKNNEHGHCTIDLGVNNTAILDASVWNSQVSDPCAGLQNAVKAVITTLKGGS